MNNSRKFILVIIAIIALIILSIFIVYLNRNTAFVYVAMLWVAAMLALAYFTKGKPRLMVIYAAAVILALGISEAFFAGLFSKAEPKLINFSISDPQYFQHHPILGIAPQKSFQVRATKKYAEKTLYDVNYTIDKHGFRIGSEKGDDASRAALFFGGSFTFGEGVDDDETMPYRFEEIADGSFEAFNFGFHGYGPHQMLAILENQIEAPVVGKKIPRFAVYQALPSHVDRCAGNSYWDQSGPKYVLNPAGEAEYSGPFRNRFTSSIYHAAARSNMLRRWLISGLKSEPADVDLFVGIVKKAEEIFRKRYGGAFYVLIWPGERAVYSRIIARLQACQIKVIETNQILHRGKLSKKQYAIPHDNHPNTRAYQEIAEYLVGYLQ